MRLRKLSGWILVAVTAGLSCVRCGVPVCAFGAGDCAKMYQNAPGSTAQPGTNNLLVVTANPNQNLSKGQAIQIQPQGATACSNGSYNYQISPNDNSVVNLQNIFVPQSANTKYAITVTDCGSPRKTGTLNLQIN